MRLLSAVLYGLFLANLVPVSSRAQANFGRTRDSLLTQLRRSPDDTNKVYQYINLGFHYEATQLDSAGYYYRRAGALAQRLHYPRGFVRYANYYTYVLNVKGKLVEGLQLNRRAVVLARRLGDEVLYAKCLGNLGASYQLLEVYEQAIYYDLLAMPIVEKYHQGQAIIVGYANLTDLYDRLSQYRKAEWYGRRAVRLARRSNQPPYLLMALTNLSVPLQHQQKYREATQFLTQGLVLSQQTQNGYLEANFLLNLGNLAVLQGQYEQAQDLTQRALSLTRKLNLPANEADALLSLGLVQLHQRHYDQAARIARQGEAFMQQHGIKVHLTDVLRLRSDAELGLGDMARFDRYRQRVDSLNEQQVGRKVILNTQRLEAQFQSAAKAGKIRQLQQDRQIQALRITRQNTLLYGSVAVLMALLLAGGLLYRNGRTQQLIARQTDLLQHQRIRELEQEKQLLTVEAVLPGQEDERSRLAKDLHDGLGGLLSGVKMTLAASLSSTTMLSAQLLPGESAQSLERAIALLDESIVELRRVARNLMPEALVRFGLVEALRDYCATIDGSVGVAIHFQAVNLADRLPATMEITLFRIAQELLNNAVKHAQATEIIVQLVGYDGQCSLTVEDNGQGFDTEHLAQSRGSGWTSIRSRVDYLGGQLDLQSNPGLGTSVLIEIPIRSEPASSHPPG